MQNPDLGVKGFDVQCDRPAVYNKLHYTLIMHGLRPEGKYNYETKIITDNYYVQGTREKKRS